MYFSKSAGLVIGASTTSASTVPFVPGVHDFGRPMIGITCGSVMCA